MDVFNLVPGTKVDIRLLQSANREGRDESEGHYVSGISDIERDGTLILDMPMRAGKVVLIPMGVRYEFIFTTEARLYKADAEIVTRFRKGALSFLKAKLLGPIEKFQRREYYRLGCLIPVVFVKLPDEVGSLESMAEVRSEMQKNTLELAEGTISNISGGGIRFVTDADLSETNYVFVRFSILSSDNKERAVALVAEIVGSGRTEDKAHNAYRARIHYKDSRLQETVIRFIFEQERRNRRKELGV